MTTSKTNLIAILTVAAGMLTASPAFAKHGGNGGGNNGGGKQLQPISSTSLSNKLSNGGYTISATGSNISLGNKLNNGGYTISQTGSNTSLGNKLKNGGYQVADSTLVKGLKNGGYTIYGSDPSKKGDDHKCHDHCYFNCFDRCYYRCGADYGCIRTCDLDVTPGRSFDPFHSTYVVLPGDTFYTVSLKEYGTSSNAGHIANFNRLAESAALVPGQTLNLPTISAKGTLSMSRASAAGSEFPGAFNTAFANPNGSTPFVTPASFTTPSSSTTPVNTTLPVRDLPRTKVVAGSTLLVDGQSFGEKPGNARLRVSGLSLPIAVLEWTTGAVKIHLPTPELLSSTDADIEVLRADGSLASKTGIELTAPVQVALGK